MEESEVTVKMEPGDIKSEADNTSIVPENIKPELDESCDPAASTPVPAPAMPKAVQEPVFDAIFAETDTNFPDPQLESVLEDNFAMPDSFNASVSSSGQTLTGANMTFKIGDRAEMLSNNGDIWHIITILDMDVEEREILCHFEDIANSDEWICADSNRIRPVTVKPKVIQKLPEYQFKIQEKVMATWSDSRKFPAVVKNILPNGSYEVLFMDGFKKTLKPHKLTKFTRKDQENFQKNHPDPIPAAPPIMIPSLPFGSELTSKEERRKLKRKHSVKELFGDHRKRQKKDDTLVVKKDPNNDSPLKITLKRKRPDEPSVLANIETKCPTEGQFIQTSSVSPANGEASVDGHKRKRFKNRKADYDYEAVPTFTPVKRPPVESALSPPIKPPTPSNGSPVEHVEPYRRIPKLVIDDKLPSGWSKYCVLKKCGTKFDVYIQSPEGRKCRSRSEIEAICNEKKEPYVPENFDFVVRGGSKRKRRRKKMEDAERHGNILRKPFQKSEKALEKVTVSVPTPIQTPLDPSRRIKTLLPKAKTLDATPETPVTPALGLVSTPIPSSGESGGTASSSTASSSIANPSGAGVICPINHCRKLFRTEQLHMMHVKHYHPEYTALLGSTPNVADLAYARTIGQPVEEVSPSTSFLDKLNWLEKQKAAASKSPSSGSSPQLSALSPSLKRPESEVSEEKIPIAEEKKVVPPLPRRVSEPCQSAKVPSIESPAPEIKEPVITNSEPSVSTPPEPDIDRPVMNTMAKIQPPVLETFPKRRRFSKYGRNSMDGDSPSVSGKSGKKRTISTSKSSTVSDYNESSLDASESGAESTSANGAKLEQLKKEEVINCTCGYKEEDGLMIQCDLCLCWQHGMCNSIESEDEVPEKYICCICLNPYRQRPSRQYTYNQDWLKEGTLPKFSFRARNGPEVAHREFLLKRSHGVTATLVQLESVLHSLQAKINVAEKADHPKLYLWSKPWNDDKINKEEKLELKIKEEPEPEINEAFPSISGNIPGPEPEAPIDPIECRQRLLDHIDSYQNQIESRLTSLEAQIAALESQDPDLANDETPDFYPQTKQTIQMVMKDLQTVRRIATLS